MTADETVVFSFKYAFWRLTAEYILTYVNEEMEKISLIISCLKLPKRSQRMTLSQLGKEL